MEEKEKEKKRHGWRIALVLLALLLLAAVASALLSTYGLTVSHYEAASSKLTGPVRVVHLTDLHNSEFGKENSRLIRKVAEQKPDLILISGDMLNYNEERTDIAENAIRGLAEIAPVYVSFGNHEKAYERRYGTDLTELYTAAGAEVLEFSTADVTVNGQELCIGGFYGYGVPAIYLATDEAQKNEVEFLQEMEKEEAYTILLCHLPLAWLRIDALENWHFDCVLTGHIHGGQLRFPFVGGLWAPDQGWFPGMVCGQYYSEDGTHFMELSRGLGNTEKIPRFNNIPEIVVLDLLPDHSGE